MDELDRESLDDMLRYATEAVRLLGPASEHEFLADVARLHAVCRFVQIVGEAAGCIPVSHQLQFPDIPWKDVIGMRHRLVHGYREVRYPVVFKTVQNDLPNLIASLERLLAEPDR
jgi:uncharacterized protein with HEPN domain